MPYLWHVKMLMREDHGRNGIDAMTTSTAKVRLAFETEYKRNRSNTINSSSSCSSVNG